MIELSFATAAALFFVAGLALGFAFGSVFGRYFDPTIAARELAGLPPELDDAADILQNAWRAHCREAWADGPTMSEVIDDADQWLLEYHGPEDWEAVKAELFPVEEMTESEGLE